MKRGLALLLALLMLLLSGCGGIFSHSYHSERAFQGNQELDLNSNVQVVQNYSQLRRLVFNMMNNHEESAELLFSGYTGNVVSDITSVCNALKTESAYGAYCVEYGSYDLTQIVSYYEATINISYLYPKEELDAMHSTTNLESFGELLAQELERGTQRFAVKINNGAAEQETVNTFVNTAMQNHPMSISYEPKVNVKIYTGNSSQKVYEVSVQYDESMDNRRRLDEMTSVVDRAAGNLHDQSDGQKIVSAARFLHENGGYSQIGGGLAYDGLVEGSANSKGLASAMQAICMHLDIPCMVVSGREDRLDHYWNIVQLDDVYYHVDVSTMGTLGEEGSLFLRDEDKRIGYWWDQSAYPYCDGELMYDEIILPKIEN